MAEPTDGQAEGITGPIRWENFFSMRRIAEALLAWLLVAIALRDTDFGTGVAIVVAILYYILRSVLNDSPLYCPHCHKAVKWDASVCHQAGAR